MKNKQNWGGMLTIALIFGMTVVSCITTSVEPVSAGVTDPALLIGTWTAGSEELKFNNNGSLEASARGPAFKGTYTAARDGRITVTITQLHGGLPEYKGILESKWYTNTELKAALVTRGAVLTNAEQKQIDGLFAPSTGTYSISGNKLTMILPGIWGGKKATYTNSQLSSQPASGRYMLVNADTLNVRSGPSAEHSLVGALPRNTRVEVLDRSGTWWKIKSGKIEGYVNSSYLINEK